MHAMITILCMINYIHVHMHFEFFHINTFMPETKADRK